MFYVSGFKRAPQSIIFLKNWVYLIPERSATSDERINVFLFVWYKFPRELLAQYIIYLTETFWVHKWDYEIFHLIQYSDKQESIDVADRLSIRILCILALPHYNIFISFLNKRYWLLCWDNNYPTCGFGTKYNPTYGVCVGSNIINLRCFFANVETSKINKFRC